MKLIAICLLGCIAIAGCSGIDAAAYSAKNQNCVRQCSSIYSTCIGNAMGIGSQMGCSSGFKACSNSCPDK